MAEKKNKDRNNAVEQLVELRPFLMEKAALWLRSIQLSDDVVQNVLIQLINKKHLLKSIVNIKAYSLTMLRREIAKMNKEDKAKKLVLVKKQDEAIADTAYLPFESDPYDSVNYDSILELMTDDEAMMLNMKYKKNMTNVQMAKLLNMSESNVRKRMTAIHAKAAKIITKMIEENE